MTPIYDELWIEYFKREQDLEVITLRKPTFWGRVKAWVDQW